MGDITIHDCTGHRVHILVGSRAAGREEADVMTLLTYNNSDLDLQDELACGLSPFMERILLHCQDDPGLN